MSTGRHRKSLDASHTSGTLPTSGSRLKLHALDRFVRREIDVGRLGIELQVAAARQAIVVGRLAVPRDVRLADFAAS